MPPASGQQIYLTRSGQADFISNAPLELIKASSTELEGVINLEEKAFAFVISIKSFRGFNSDLQQEHFYENYMEVQDFPTASFKGKIIEQIDPDLNTEQTVRAKGVLNIHGVDQERIIRGTIRIDGDQVEVKAGFSVMLEDHRMKIPRVVYQKIAESIDVSIHATLNKKPFE